ncbi:MAG: SRPBCC domain-containing protein [Devosia sp.]
MTLNPARSIADVTQGTVLASIEIAVPPERVFAALSDGNEISRWWGSPHTYTTEKWHTDFRVGGHWRADGRGSDGKPFFVEGTFLEIDPPWRIVQTWEPGWTPDLKTRLTYQLSATEAGTRLVVRHEGFGGKAKSCDDHATGWIRVLGWLAEYIGPKPAAEPDHSLYFLARLLGPRPSFMQDMNDEEREMMIRHGAYWRAMQDQGKMLLFGPVADPSGGWGMGVLKVASEEELHELQGNDPAILGNRGLRYENLPMPRVIYRQP